MYRKKTITTLLTILFLASIVAIPVQAAGPNLVVNGNFESPVVTHSAKWDVFPSGTAGLGWTVDWAGAYGAPEPAKLELHRGVNGWLSYGGSQQHAELDTDWTSGSLEPASVKIYQDLATVPYGVYTLTYAWSPRPGHSDNELKVYFDGVLIGSYSGSGGSNTVWTLETYIITVSGSSTHLEFVEVGTPDSLGMFLDAVSVVFEYIELIEVSIDIKPGSDPNSINPDAQGLLPVAILGSASFDVNDVDINEPITLGNAGLATRGKAEKPACSYEDINGDGFTDLMTFFPVNALGLVEGDTALTLEAKLLDGTPIVGSDFVRIVPLE